MEHCCETMDKAVKDNYIDFYPSTEMDDDWKKELKEMTEACGGKYIEKDYTEPFYKVWLHNKTVLVWSADVNYCPWCGKRLEKKV